MKNKKLLIIILSIVCLVTITYGTYSYYAMNFNVSVNGNTANLVCDAEIESVSNDEKSIFGYSEFKVVVKNNKDSTRTGLSFNYTLTFENKAGSDAIFGYNNEFDNNLTINGSMGSSSNETNTYIIQVKSNNGLSENIDYNVNLSCKQS